MRQNNDEGTPNIGTTCKATLQEQALKFMQKYPNDRTAKQYANLLCWDIRVSRRTALESYIEPMIEHGILVYSGKNRYRFSPEYNIEESEIPLINKPNSPKQQAEQIAKMLKEEEAQKK